MLLNEWDRLCQGRPPIFEYGVDSGNSGQVGQGETGTVHGQPPAHRPGGFFPWCAGLRSARVDLLKKGTDLWNMSSTFLY
jgi:hypothetical protein